MKVAEYTTKQFLDALASNAPAPGGGGGAALAGSLGAALGSMVANLTIGKEKFAAREEEVNALLAETEALRAELLALVDADAEVFNSFMACYKLPKATEKEKAARTQAICNAAKQAAGVPLAIARASAKVVTLAERLAVVGNPGVVTDAACSGLLARAALRSAEYNVRINLGLTHDEAFNASAEKELETLLAAAGEKEAALLETTDKALGITR